MRGEDVKQEAMFSYVSPEQRVPMDHPLRPVREMVDTVLKEMSPRFARLYAKVGRPSMAPERLLRKVQLRGLQKVGWWFPFVGAAYNLVRLRRRRAEAVA